MATKGKKKVQGGANNCKVCKHEHIVEIETAMIIKKMPSREVEKMIDDNGWEPISYPTILNHMKNHVDSKRELILRYLDEKRQILDNALSVDDDPETDEMIVRLNELKKLDVSIQEAMILVRQSSKALQEQLSLRVQHPDKNNKTKTGNKLTGSDGKDPDTRRSYVPIQRDLIALYKGSSEELRMTIKTKMDTLGIDAESRKASNIETLVDLIIDKSKTDEE